MWMRPAFIHTRPLPGLVSTALCQRRSGLAHSAVRARDISTETTHSAARTGTNTFFQSRADTRCDARSSANAPSTDSPSEDAMYGRWSFTTSASGENVDSGASVTKNHAVANANCGVRHDTRSATSSQLTRNTNEAEAIGVKGSVVYGKSWSTDRPV